MLDEQDIIGTAGLVERGPNGDCTRIVRDKTLNVDILTRRSDKRIEIVSCRVRHVLVSGRREIKQLRSGLRVY
jgi:hypothetical protein